MNMEIFNELHQCVRYHYETEMFGYKLHDQDKCIQEYTERNIDDYGACPIYIHDYSGDGSVNKTLFGHILSHGDGKMTIRVLDSCNAKYVVENYDIGIMTSSTANPRYNRFDCLAVDNIFLRRKR